MQKTHVTNVHQLSSAPGRFCHLPGQLHPPAQPKVLEGVRCEHSLDGVEHTKHLAVLGRNASWSSGGWSSLSGRNCREARRLIGMAVSLDCNSYPIFVRRGDGRAEELHVGDTHQR